MALALPSGNLVLDKDLNTLIIKEIETKHSDGYSCVVENSLGRQLVTSNITVIPKGREKMGKRSTVLPFFDSMDHKTFVTVVYTCYKL